MSHATAETPRPETTDRTRFDGEALTTPTTEEDALRPEPIPSPVDALLGKLTVWAVVSVLAWLVILTVAWAIAVLFDL